jgi:hypothetical protein
MSAGGEAPGCARAASRRSLERPEAATSVDLTQAARYFGKRGLARQHQRVGVSPL